MGHTPIPRIVDYVERELKKNPDIPYKELQARAAKLEPEIAELRTRQFSASYPLQVKRRWKRAAEGGGGAGGKGGRKKSAKGGRGKTSGGAGRRRTQSPEELTPTQIAMRERMRGVFFEFMKDVSGAEEKTDFVDLLSNLDNYVDRAIDAAEEGRGG